MKTCKTIKRTGRANAQRRKRNKPFHYRKPHYFKNKQEKERIYKTVRKQ